jgi:hypothetical protein
VNNVEILPHYHENVAYTTVDAVYYTNEYIIKQTNKMFERIIQYKTQGRIIGIDDLTRLHEEFKLKLPSEERMIKYLFQINNIPLY